MKKILSSFLSLFLLININSGIAFGGNVENIKNFNFPKILDSETPTIFLPGIMASWYSEEKCSSSGRKKLKNEYDNKKFDQNYFSDKFSTQKLCNKFGGIKQWEVDPITGSYEFFLNFMEDSGYKIYYIKYNNNNTPILDFPKDADIKRTLFVFGYDWKKDIISTAHKLDFIVGEIYKHMEQQGMKKSLNIVGHSMGGLVARAFASGMCANYEYRDSYYTSLFKYKPNKSKCDRFNSFYSPKRKIKQI